jgi:translocation and assembly module TamB
MLGRALTRLARLPWISTALLLTLLAAVDSAPGRDLLARALSAASGGVVVVDGLDGELPFRARIRRLTLADGNGVWLHAEHVALVLRPAALLRGELDIRALAIRRLDLVRPPKAGAGDGLGLPVPVRLRALAVAQLASPALGPGWPPLAVTGNATARHGQVDAALLLTPPGRADAYRLTIEQGAQGARLGVSMSEAADGPIATLARSAGLPLPPGLADWTLEAQAQLVGAFDPDRLDLSWALDLKVPKLLGPGADIALDARGQATGTALAPRLAADLALRRVRSAAQPAHWPGQDADETLRGRLELEPLAPAGRLRLAGRWLGEPAGMTMALAPLPRGGIELRLDDGRWGVLTLAGRLQRPSDTRLATGDLALGIARLAEAVPQLLSLPGVHWPLEPDADWASRLDGRLQARLEWSADGRVRLIADGPGTARLDLIGRLDPAARRLTLRSLQLDAQARRLTLRAPAVVDFGSGLTLAGLRLGLSAPALPGVAGELVLDGRLAPRLALDARLDGLTLAAVAPWLPPRPTATGGALQGVLDAEAHLAGSVAAPTGRVSLRGRDLTVAAAARRGLPPAAIELRLTLAGTAAQLAAEARLGERANIALDGRIGGALWAANAPLDLRGRAQLDLALLDPWLAAGGRQAKGRVRLDLGIGGTRTAPLLGGRLNLTDGAWRDRRLGLWLDGIEGDAGLHRAGLRIERLLARAGGGSLALSGDIDWLAPGRPLDLRLRARGAEPVRQDLLKLRGDAELGLRGALGGDLRMGGEVRLAELDIRIPERLPAEIPTLKVLELGERRQPRPSRPAVAAWPARLQLDVRLDAARGVLVRGRNIDAELGGDLRLTGSAAAPAAEGGFVLLRGEYLLVGQPLRFSRGRIGLDGADLLNPTLDFEARAQGPGATAILAIEGRARDPRLVLRGEPPMTDDEVLSRLLFGVAPGRLSAFQLTRLGLASANIAGIGFDGGGLLERARAGLGLPRLRLDSDRRGDGVLESGGNLSERVYLGARQGVAGGEPRAVLGLQLAPQIRFESDVGGRGAGAGAAFELEY